MALNVTLLREIQKQILTQPKTFFMADWIRRKEHRANTYFINPDTQQAVQFEPCGTAGCVAGWAVLLTEKKGEEQLNEGGPIQWKAKDLLGLTQDEMALFSVAHWGPLSAAYHSAGSDLCRAVVAAKVIDRLIERHKADK